MGDSLSGVTHVAKYLPKEAIQTALIDSADNEKHGKSSSQNKEENKSEDKDKVELSEEALHAKTPTKSKVEPKKLKDSSNSDTIHFDVKI